MKHLISLVMIVVAIGLGTFGSSFSKEVYEILFGGRPVALYLSQVWGGVFNPLWFEGSALLGCVKFPYQELYSALGEYQKVPCWAT